MAYTLTSPIAVTINSVAHSLVLINQDSYGSEYLDRTTDVLYEVRLKIRHSVEKLKADLVAYDRHNVELTLTTYGIGGLPDTSIQHYTVFRNPKGAASATVKNVGLGFAALLTSDNYLGLVGWRN